MTTKSLNPALPPLKAFWRSLLALGTARQLGLLALVILGTFAEGLGIFLLIPLGSILFGWSSPDSQFGDVAQLLLARFGQDGGLAIMLAGFILLMLVRAVILYQRDTGLYALSSELVDRWRARMISALVQAEWRPLRALNRGNIEFAVTNDVSRLASGSDQLLRGIVALVQLLVLVAMAVQLSPALSLAAAALLIPAIPLSAMMVRAAYAHGQTLTRLGGKRHGAFGEFMAGIKLAKAHRAESRYAAEFLKLSDEIRGSSLAYFGTHLRSNLAFQLMAAVLAAALLWTGGVVLKTSPAVLAAVLLLFARLPGPAMVLVQGAQSLAMLVPAIANLQRLEQDLASAPVPMLEAPPLHHEPPAIALRKVTVRYAPDRIVLHNLDIEIPAGELTLLLGPSGSGKTTLGDVLIGLTTADAGSLIVDGLVIDSAAARHDWRARIGYVPQDPFLFDMSIADNMRWAAPDATDADIWDALQAADAAHFVRNHADGLAARAGDRGGYFSGGERQRLCLARALLRKPALLMLDEATSALDPDSEQRLLSALQELRGKTTILMIAHRIPVGFVPDRTYRLDEGSIAA